MESLTNAELFSFPLTSLKQRAAALGVVSAQGDPEKKASWVAAIQHRRSGMAAGGAAGAAGAAAEVEGESGQLD